MKESQVQMLISTIIASVVILRMESPYLDILLIFAGIISAIIGFISIYEEKIASKLKRKKRGE